MKLQLNNLEIIIDMEYYSLVIVENIQLFMMEVMIVFLFFNYGNFVLLNSLQYPILWRL